MDTMVLVAIAVAMIVGLLVLTMVVATYRADSEITIRGPLATLEELDARIAGKQTTLDELEEELEKRRKAIGEIANVQAEVDALIRQHDELQAELHQFDDRRREIEKLRGEAIELGDERARIESELVERRAEFERLEAELERAERLLREREAVERELQELEKKAAVLREEVTDLATLRKREKELREEMQTLKERTAVLQAQVTDLDGRRERAETEAQAAETRLAELRENLTSQVADHAAVTRQLATMEEQRAELLAQIESLKEKTGISHGDGKGAHDPLAELRALPPTLEALRSKPLRDLETEDEALHRVSSHMQALGLEYHPRVLRAFHTAMKINETTQMAILAGISGTGKSQLPRRYAEAMGIGFLQVAVQPRWDSPQDLMGFYNYIESRYRPTDLARTLFHLDPWNGPKDSHDLNERMMLILLDEMNLARVEYYFSDFLSRLENRPAHNEEHRAEARKDSEIELDIPMPDGKTAPRLYPGYNLLFAGTMNEDESTQSLSDKVIDRANLLRFAAPKDLKKGIAGSETAEPRALSVKQWRGWLRAPEALARDQDRVNEQIQKLLELMTGLGRPFGHRLGRAMRAYVANYPYRGQEGQALDVHIALADQVEMRLLPKLRGVEIDTFGAKIEALAEHVDKELRDEMLAQAIRDSLRHAEDSTGQFLWRGVSRE